MSKLVAERGGVGLMPELGYAPVNRTCRRGRAARGDDAVAGDRGAAGRNARHRGAAAGAALARPRADAMSIRIRATVASLRR